MTKSEKKLRFLSRYISLLSWKQRINYIGSNRNRVLTGRFDRSVRPVSIQRRAVSVSSASVQSAAFAELLKRNLSLPEAGGIGAVLYFQLGEKV